MRRLKRSAPSCNVPGICFVISNYTAHSVGITIKIQDHTRASDRPWRETFLHFIAEQPGATFHHTSEGQGVISVYSRDGDKGLWYLVHRFHEPIIRLECLNAVREAIHRSRGSPSISATTVNFLGAL